MNLKILQVSADFSSSPQVSVEDVAQIAAQGFKTIINCRPDGEGGATQPTSEQIRAAAEQQGMHYLHFPIAMGTGAAQHAAEAAAQMAAAPKPMLGFCRSGIRATNLYNEVRSNVTTAGASEKKTAWQWLKSKCLITRLWRKLQSKS